MYMLLIIGSYVRYACSYNVAGCSHSNCNISVAILCAKMYKNVATISTALDKFTI